MARDFSLHPLELIKERVDDLRDLCRFIAGSGIEAAGEVPLQLGDAIEFLLQCAGTDGRAMLGGVQAPQFILLREADADGDLHRPEGQQTHAESPDESRADALQLHEERAHHAHAVELLGHGEERHEQRAKHAGDAMHAHDTRHVIKLHAMKNEILDKKRPRRRKSRQSRSRLSGLRHRSRGNADEARQQAVHKAVCEVGAILRATDQHRDNAAERSAEQRIRSDLAHRAAAAAVEPALKPIQPTSSNIAPVALSTCEWPWIGRAFPLASKRPMRGPRTMMPANAIQAPTECTVVDPAKSMKPAAASQGLFSVMSPRPRPNGRTQDR